MTTAIVKADIQASAITLSPEAEQARDELILAASEIQSVRDATELELAVAMGVRMRTAVKSAEDDRLAVKRPLLDIGKRIDEVAKGKFIEPITEAMNRIGRLVSGFRIAEEVRKREEERQRAEEVRKAVQAQQEAEEAKAEAERHFAETQSGLQHVVEADQAVEQATEAFREIVTAPRPEVAKAKGAATRMVVKWRITDEDALFKAAPHFFELTPRKRVINDCVTAKSEFPGLEVWEEPDTSFRSGGRQ